MFVETSPAMVAICSGMDYYPMTDIVPDEGAGMKNPIVDHRWAKISELDSHALAAAREKLSEVEALEQKISLTDGLDAADNILVHGAIKHALKRCIEFHEGAPGLTTLDLYINYGFATQKAMAAERTIDIELDDIDL
ncbi:hypothetical protein G7009_12970 [Pseudomonas capeferrum]|uniref:hypothetical protein n=1 Tax=Pseudomonas capeferrum TaxID=1495066 RepID=UPI0015E31975|nr:hypothetical protein [Pseudomonas capeferrum]MBA1202657.1 hypothetical protein [Pseudomonas capeferrum]